MESASEQQSLTANVPLLPEPKAARGRPFVKGQSGNPNGRPRKSETVVHFLQSAPAKRNRRIADRILSEAEAGSIRHAELVTAYQSGTPMKQETTMITAAPELLEAITAMHAMKARLLGEVIEGEYTATEAQRDG